MSLLLAQLTPATFVPDEEAVVIVAPAAVAPAAQQPWSYDQSDLPTPAKDTGDAPPLVVTLPTTTALDPWSYEQNDIVATTFVEETEWVQLAPWPPPPASTLTIFDPSEVTVVAHDDEDSRVVLPVPPQPPQPEPWRHEQNEIVSVGNDDSEIWYATKWSDTLTVTLDQWIYEQHEKASPTAAEEDWLPLTVSPTLGQPFTPWSSEQNEIVSVGNDDSEIWYATKWADSSTTAIDLWLQEQNEIVSVGNDDSEVWYTTKWIDSPTVTLDQWVYEQGERASPTIFEEDWLLPPPAAVIGIPLAPWLDEQNEIVSVGNDDSETWLTLWSELPRTVFLDAWLQEQNEIVSVGNDDSEIWYTTKWTDTPTFTLDLWPQDQNEIVSVGTDDSEAWYRTEWASSPTITLDQWVYEQHEKASPTVQEEDWLPLPPAPVVGAPFAPWVDEQNEIISVGNDDSEMWVTFWSELSRTVFLDPWLSEQNEIVSVGNDDSEMWVTFWSEPSRTVFLDTWLQEQNEIVSVGNDDGEAWYRTEWAASPTIMLDLWPQEQHEIVSVGTDDSEVWYATKWTDTQTIALDLWLYEQDERASPTIVDDEWLPTPPTLQIGLAFAPWNDEQNEIVSVGTDDSEIWYRTKWTPTPTTAIEPWQGEQNERPTPPVPPPPPPPAGGGVGGRRIWAEPICEPEEEVCLDITEEFEIDLALEATWKLFCIVNYPVTHEEGARSKEVEKKLGLIERLRRLVALSGSDNPHEARAAADQLARMLREKGLIEDLAEYIQHASKAGADPQDSAVAKVLHTFLLGAGPLSTKSITLAARSHDVRQALQGQRPSRPSALARRADQKTFKSAEAAVLIAVVITAFAIGSRKL